MKTNNVFKEFLHYTSLNILGMLELSCYIFADTFFVSKGMGANGLTALNLAIPIYSFIYGTGLLLGIGGAAKYSLLRSRNENAKAKTVFTNTLLPTLIFSAIFVSAGLMLSDKIAYALGADVSTIEMTKTYLKTILLFSPAFLLNNLILCFVRNDGNPRLSMIAMVSGSLSNVILDYVFIFPLNGGIFGAAVATGIAPIISLIILSMHFICKKNQFGIIKTKLSPALIINILSLGLPSLITELSSGIVIMVFNKIILTLDGNIGVAAYGVIANLSLVAISVFTGLAQGIQPLISRFYGRRDIGGIRSVMRYAIISASVIFGVIYTVVFLFADKITEVFNSEKNVRLQETAVFGMKIYFTALIFAGLNVIISMYFAASEKPFPAQTISLLRGFLLIIPLALIFSNIWGIIGVWLSFPFTELITSLTAVVFVKRIYKNNF